GSRPDDTLGAVRVRDVSRQHAGALVSGLRQDGFAPATTGMTYRTFSRLLDRAVSYGVLSTHPVDRDFYKTELLPKLKRKAPDVKALTPQQVQAFLAVSARSCRYHALFVTGFLTGCRVGELQGLQFADDQVNAQHVRQLRIARQLQRGSTTTPITIPTKTDK